MMLTRPLTSLSLLLAASAIAQLLVSVGSLSVEQSFGGTWSDAGSITGLQPSKGGLSTSAAVFVRNKLSAADKEQLLLAASKNGLYTLKLNLGGSDRYVVTSVRAACLLQAQDEQLRVHVDEEGRILGAQYEVVPSECTGSPSQAALERQLAPAVPVKLQSPKPGPIVIFTGGEDMLGAQRGKKGPQAQPPAQVQQEGQAGGEGGEQAAADGKPRRVPKEEQTWWQRNWVYIAILFGLGLQVLKAQLEPQVQEMQRQEAAQRRAAAGGAAGAAGGAGAGRGQAVRRRG